MKKTDWAATPEGRKAIEESIRRGDKMADRIKKSLSIDIKKLGRPFTI
jgi:hypothetical protein